MNIFSPRCTNIDDVIVHRSQRYGRGNNNARRRLSVASKTYCILSGTWTLNRRQFSGPMGCIAGRSLCFMLFCLQLYTDVANDDRLEGVAS